VDDESQGKGSLEPVTAGSPPAAARPRQSTRAFLVPVVVFVGLAVLAAVVGAVLYSRQAAEVRTRQGAQLTAVRDLKSDEITRWMDDQRADAALISGDGLLGEALERWIKRGHATPARRRSARSWSPTGWATPTRASSCSTRRSSPSSPRPRVVRRSGSPR